jgi:hypothetical protein
MAEGPHDQGVDVDQFKLGLEALASHLGFSPATVNYEHTWSVVGSWRLRAPKSSIVVLQRPSRCDADAGFERRSSDE